MKLINLINEDIIHESDATRAAVTHTFNYIDRKGIQKNPHIVYLGDWDRKMKKGGETRKYACGINLNYLSDTHKSELRSNLVDILDAGGLKARYEMGAELLPHIFRGPKTAGIPEESDAGQLPPNGAYRTYRIDDHDGSNSRRYHFVTGRLMVLIADEEDIMLAKKLGLETLGKEWDELTDREKSQLKEQAFRERGEHDESRRKEAEKDRKLIEPEPDIEDDVPSRADDLEAEPEYQDPPSPEPPPGSPDALSTPSTPGRKLLPQEPREKFSRADPGPGIEMPKPKPRPKGKVPTARQKLSPTQTGATNIAMPDPNRIRIDQASPPADSTNVTDVATKDPTDVKAKIQPKPLSPDSLY